MIYSSVKPEGFQNWSEVPVSAEKEVLAEEAELKFSAKASLTEKKMQRVFNGTMFFIAGANLVNLVLPVGALITKLGGMGLAAIGGASLLQIPTVAAIMALAPKIILAIAIIQVVRKVLSVVINLIIYPAMLKTRTGVR